MYVYYKDVQVTLGMFFKEEGYTICSLQVHTNGIASLFTNCIHYKGR